MIEKVRIIQLCGVREIMYACKDSRSDAGSSGGPHAMPMHTTPQHAVYWAALDRSPHVCTAMQPEQHTLSKIPEYHFNLTG